MLFAFLSLFSPNEFAPLFSYLKKNKKAVWDCLSLAQQLIIFTKATTTEQIFSQLVFTCQDAVQYRSPKQL